MTCKLYYHPQSNFARKIRILLMEKKIDYELEAIELSAKPEYFLKISPIGKVPVFVDEDGTVIWDSSLIAEYLEEKYPHPHLCPQTFQEKIACRKWEEMADTLGDHVIDLWIQGLFNQGKVTRYQSLLQEKISRIIPVFEEQLKQTKYLLGNETWSMADIAALCSFAYHDLRLNEDWKNKYPHLKNWFNDLHNIESVKLTVPPKKAGIK
ncbi:glutathione S-transferase family protein [Euhalothece natronophila Z-M001]|uniref:Glutathione S-transferase family protein n=1 Tax=Euhalothece natronophila Z-M001 TaxID=522448 RepID=A0A5B8NLT9_9CHRO|nr:glutathione S-transferase family protein [Euhalothece natronophila]QDZ39235.1 glutathione S-transferase family protein [Euhalothece natronophila Z-M001]